MFSAGFSWLDAVEESRAWPVCLAGPARVTLTVPARLWGQERGPSPPLLPWTCRIPQEMWFGATSSTRLSSLQMHPCNLEAGGGEQDHLKVFPFSWNQHRPSPKTHSKTTHPSLIVPPSICCPHPHPLHAQMPAAPRTCPRTRPPRLLLLRLPGWGRGHPHRSASRWEPNAGGKHISGSINAIHGRGGCAGAGLGTRICLQR